MTCKLTNRSSSSIVACLTIMRRYFFVSYRRVCYSTAPQLGLTKVTAAEHTGAVFPIFLSRATWVYVSPLGKPTARAQHFVCRIFIDRGIAKSRQGRIGVHVQPRSI